MTATLLLLLASLFTHLEPAVALDRAERAGRADRAEHALAPAPDGVAMVQVELLADPDAAARLAANIRGQLDANGLALTVAVELVTSEPGLPVSYRVVLGPFAEFEDAEWARTELEALGVRGFVRELELAVGC